MNRVTPAEAARLSALGILRLRTDPDGTLRGFAFNHEGHLVRASVADVGLSATGAELGQPPFWTYILDGGAPQGGWDASPDDTPESVRDEIIRRLRSP